MKKKERINYIKLGIILLISVLATILICNIYHSYNKNKAKQGYLAKYVKKIDYKELSSTMTELNSNTFIYLTYTGNEKVYNFEKELRKIIKQNDYEDNFIYVDCTLELKDNYAIKNLNSIISVGNKEIILPAIIYFKDSNPTDYIDSSNGLLEVGNYQQLLDKYELESSEK